MKNAKNWCTFSRPVAYAAGVLVTAIVFAARYMLHSYVEPYAPFQAFLFGCIVVEYYFGLGPALLSLVLSLVLGIYYFIRPYESFAMVTRSDVIVVGNFVLISLFIIGLVEVLRRTLHANQLLLKVSQSRHLVSLFRENDRLFLSRKNANTASEVERLLAQFDGILLLQVNDSQFYPQALLYRLAPALSPAAGEQSGWLAAFHPDDHAALAKAFNHVRDGSATCQAISARMRDDAPSSPPHSLLLDRFKVEGMRVAVLRLADEASSPTLPTLPPLPAEARKRLTDAVESPPRKPSPSRLDPIPG